MKIFLLVMLGIGVYIGGLILTAFISKLFGADIIDDDLAVFLFIWPLTLVFLVPALIIVGLVKLAEIIVWGRR